MLRLLPSSRSHVLALLLAFSLAGEWEERETLRLREEWPERIGGGELMKRKRLRVTTEWIDPVPFSRSPAQVQLILHPLSWFPASSFKTASVAPSASSECPPLFPPLPLNAPLEPRRTCPSPPDPLSSAHTPRTMSLSSHSSSSHPRNSLIPVRGLSGSSALESTPGSSSSMSQSTPASA